MGTLYFRESFQHLCGQTKENYKTSSHHPLQLRQARLITTHRLNRLLTSLYSQILLFISQTLQNNLVHIFCFLRSSIKILRTLSSSSFIQRVIWWSLELIPKMFDHIRCLNSWWSSSAFAIFQDFHCCPKILLTIKKHMSERQHCHHMPVSSAGKFQ